MVVMLLYWLGITTADLVAKEGWLPPAVALWIPNALVLGLAVWMIRRASRVDS